MGFEGQIPTIAKIELKTVTPLHIGSGADLIWTGTAWKQCQQVVKVTYQSGNDEPYIPGSTVRGMLRALYEFACELGGQSPDSKDIFGSTNKASKIKLSDLYSTSPVSLSQLRVKCICPHDANCQKVIHRNGFEVEIITRGETFQGELDSINDTLSHVLYRIYSQRAGIVDQLNARGKSEEVTLAKKRGYVTEILKNPDDLFQHPSDKSYTLTWKLGKFAKQYTKLLKQGYTPKSGKRGYFGPPYAFFTIPSTKELLGWIQLTIDLEPKDDTSKSIASYHLNQW